MALNPVGGIWLKEKNGKKFGSMSIDNEKFKMGEDGKTNMLMYKNDYKEKDNQPDYKIFQIQDDEEQQAPQTKPEDDGENIPF